MPPSLKLSKALILANVVGVVHFIIGNLSIFLGQYTPILRNFDPYGKYPGISFVRNFLDAPVMQLLFWFDRSAGDDFLYTMLVTEFIILASSFIYGGIVYLIARGFTLLLD